MKLVRTYYFDVNIPGRGGRGTLADPFGERDVGREGRLARTLPIDSRLVSLTTGECWVLGCKRAPGEHYSGGWKRYWWASPHTVDVGLLQLTALAEAAQETNHEPA